MTECRNPECRKGYSPGVITAGRGTPNAPVVGATMRWGWVKCRACNPDKDAPYQHISRSPAEVAERARLADSKAAYVNQAPADRSNLESIKASAPAQSAPASHSLNGGMVEKLMAQNEKLLAQIQELLDENRALRKRLDSTYEEFSESNRPRITVIKRKKVGGRNEVSSKGKRSLP